MAYALIHHYPGGTHDQYAATMKVVHPDGGLPPGQLYHAAGASADGWTIFATHESRESWETFRDGTLFPALAAGVPGGFEVQPVETTYEVAAESSA